MTYIGNLEDSGRIPGFRMLKDAPGEIVGVVSTRQPNVLLLGCDFKAMESWPGNGALGEDIQKVLVANGHRVRCLGTESGDAI